jgi:hypothetical protein
MTPEDFIESVIAGWVPLAWHPAVHFVVVAWKWIVLQVTAIVAVRLRRT